MARPRKLNDKRQTALIKLIKTGVSIADACAHVGIAQSTYYDWMARGEAGDEGFTEFSEAISRARVDAKITAIGTIRTAMSPFTQKSTKTQTYTEIREVKDKSGNLILDEDGKPVTYEYKEVTVTKTVTVMQGDLKAALEYLRRRYPDEWGDRLRVDTWQSELLKLVEDGVLTHEQVRADIGDELYQQFFGNVGTPILREQ